MKTALLIIDQQKGIDHPKLGIRNNPRAEEVMLKLLAIWREKAWPIFHIIHRSTDSESVFWPHQEGFEHKREFCPTEGETLVEKSVPCAFINNVLEQSLKSNSVSALVIVGVATNNSVESTARTGGNLGFDVTVIEDGCYTFEMDDFFGKPRSAHEVHAMSLANLDGEYAVVKRCAELLSELENTKQ